MRKRRLRFAPTPSVPLKVMELLLAIFTFAHGAWQVQLAWDNPRHVGWVPGGTIMMAGAMVCVWLIWRRWRTQHGTLLPIMLVSQLGGFVKDWLAWQAGDEGAVWPTERAFFVLAFIGIIIWEEFNRRKETAEDVARETRFFSMEDRL